jgi:hypothetical protein
MNLERKCLLAVKGAARLFFQRRARLNEVFFGQNARLHLGCMEPFMSLLLFARKAAICFCLGLSLGIPATVLAQTNYYTTNGTEYAVIGSLPGDQVFPDVALNSAGGFVVWQDNITDGSGWGVSAMRMDGTLSGVLSTFPVNAQGANDQENPRVALLKNGGAVFAWQGGKEGRQHIFARLMTPANTFLTATDVVVSTFASNFQINPAVAVLNNSNVVVVWASFDQASSNSLLDVYGQILSKTNGTKIGANFLINQFTNYNQRTPAIAALKNGGFVVAWVSEQERSAFNYSGINNTNGTSPNQIGLPSVDIYARLYTSNGVANGNEFLVNTGSNPCANPAVAAAADGSFMVAWGAKDMVVTDNSWDIYARSFTNASGGPVARVNSHVYGDQYAPRISPIGGDYLIVWTSLGQDGSREGVFGQYMHENGSFSGGEFQVNTTTVGQQMQPAVASDGANQFLVVWTGYTGSPNGFDLFAQRYINVNMANLKALGAPFVWAPFVIVNNVYQPQLQVSWATLSGISVSNYEVYVVGGAGTPIALTTSNVWTMTAANGLTTNSTYSFAVDYTMTNGQRSPISPPSASVTTWIGVYWGPPNMAVPYEWMQQYFGNDTSAWPAVTADTDGDGMNNWQEFLAGTIPTNSASVLNVQISNATTQTTQARHDNLTQQGLYLNWNTQPGLTYQVQVTTNFTSWSNLGSPRLATQSSDSIYVGSGAAGYYRVLLLRQ